MSNDAQTTEPKVRRDALVKSLAKIAAQSDELAVALGAVVLSGAAVVAAKAIADLIREDVERYEREVARAQVRAILAAHVEAGGRGADASEPKVQSKAIPWSAAIADGAAALIDFFPDDELSTEQPVYQRRRERVLRAGG